MKRGILGSGGDVVQDRQSIIIIGHRVPPFHSSVDGQLAHAREVLWDLGLEEVPKGVGDHTGRTRLIVRARKVEVIQADVRPYPPEPNTRAIYFDRAVPAENGATGLQGLGSSDLRGIRDKYETRNH